MHSFRLMHSCVFWVQSLSWVSLLLGSSRTEWDFKFVSSLEWEQELSCLCLSKWAVLLQRFIGLGKGQVFDGQAQLTWKLRNDSPWALSSLVKLFKIALRSHLALGGELGTPKLPSWCMVKLVREMTHAALTYSVFCLPFSSLHELRLLEDSEATWV